MLIEGRANRSRSPFQERASAFVAAIAFGLSEVDYIDSTGLGTLAGLYTSVRKASGAIKLMGLTKHVSDLLQITKLLTVFEVYNSEAEAVESFRKAA